MKDNMDFYTRHDLGNGWVKIPESSLKANWWPNHIVRETFIACILLANYKDAEWHGRVIPRGSFVSSVRELADLNRLTVRQTRTALDKLQRMGEITIEPSNQYSIITVCNYAIYQGGSEGEEASEQSSAEDSEGGTAEGDGNGDDDAQRPEKTGTDETPDKDAPSPMT